MHATNIENYVSRIAESLGKIYGEFMKELLKSHEERNFGIFMKENLRKLKA